MKGGISESATQRIDRLLDTNQDLQSDKAKLMRRVKELEEEVSQLRSDAGWRAEYMRGQVEEQESRGWK